MDRGPWWAIIHKVTKSQTQLKQLSMHTHTGKTTRPLSYDLNQIPYDYTVEVTDRFKGLDLIAREPEELWTEIRDLCSRQGSRPSPRKRNENRQNGV